MIKNEIVLAVPGTEFCKLNRRFSVVDVKKPNMIIKLSVEALLEKYLVIASKCLYEKRSDSLRHCIVRFGRITIDYVLTFSPLRSKWIGKEQSARRTSNNRPTGVPKPIYRRFLSICFEYMVDHEYVRGVSLGRIKSLLEKRLNTSSASCARSYVVYHTQRRGGS